MENRFCGQCGRPYGKQDCKPSWGFTWGIMWRAFLIYVPIAIIAAVILELLGE